MRRTLRDANPAKCLAAIAWICTLRRQQVPAARLGQRPGEDEGRRQRLVVEDGARHRVVVARFHVVHSSPPGPWF